MIPWQWQWPVIIQWHSCCSPGWCRRRGTYPGPSSRSVGECGWREWVGAAGASKGCEAASPTPARGLDITWPGGGLHPRPRPVVGPTQPPVCTSPGQPRYSWPRSSLQWTSDRQLTVRTLRYIPVSSDSEWDRTSDPVSGAALVPCLAKLQPTSPHYWWVPLHFLLQSERCWKLWFEEWYRYHHSYSGKRHS